jgi:hypothetical protein
MHPDDPVARSFANALPSNVDLEPYACIVEQSFPLGVVADHQSAPVLKQALAFTWLLTSEQSFPVDLFTIVWRGSTMVRTFEANCAGIDQYHTQVPIPIHIIRGPVGVRAVAVVGFCGIAGSASGPFWEREQSTCGCGQARNFF